MFYNIIFRFLGLLNHVHSKKYVCRRDSSGRPKSEFGRIRTDGQVRPDSGGRAGSAGFGRRAFPEKHQSLCLTTSGSAIGPGFDNAFVSCPSCLPTSIRPSARIRPNPPARPNPAELGNGTAARIRPNSEIYLINHF